MSMTRRAGAILVAVGAGAVILGSSLPWLRTGTRRRSSYELFALVDRLGFSPSGAVGWGVRLWPLVPLMVTAAAVLAWQRRRWPLLAVALLGAAYAGGVAVAIATADSPRILRVDVGPNVTAVGAVVLIIGALITSFATFRAHGDS